MTFEDKRKNWSFPVAAAALCTSAALMLTACDSRPRGGTGDADDVGNATRDWARTNTNPILTNRPAETNRDALRDTGQAIKRGAQRTADDVGRGLDKAGEEVQRQAD